MAWGAPPDWHRDPINHARAPQTFWGTIRYLDPACGDHKVIWELNRHQHWRMLGRAYWLTRKDLYRAVFLSELESWLESNPPGTGINWASMLELGFRSLSWTWAVEFFCDGTDRDETPWLVDLLVALDRQLDQVAHGLSRYFSPNTHLTGEALALYAVSTAFPELRKSRARQELGRRVLLRESTRQVNPDGGHAELSAHYHRYSTDFYLLALLVARASNDPAADRFEDIVRSHARYLRAIADDRGQLPLLGDDDGGQLFGICGGRPADAAPTLSATAAALNDPTLAVAPADEEVHWILGRRPAVSLEPEGQSSWPSQALLSSGYFVSRNRRGDHLVLDAGAHGYLSGGHSHSDALSIVLTIDGKPVLVDPGTATYTIDSALRDAFRSTRMHNTVVIDGSDHVAPRGPFQWTACAEGIGSEPPDRRGGRLRAGDAQRVRRRGARPVDLRACMDPDGSSSTMSLAPESRRLRATGTCTRCGEPTSAGSRSCCTTETARDRRSCSRRRSPPFAQRRSRCSLRSTGGSNHHARCGRRSVNARRSSWARLFPRCLARRRPDPSPRHRRAACPILGLASAFSITTAQQATADPDRGPAGYRAPGAGLFLGTVGGADQCAGCGAPSDERRLAAAVTR